VHEALRVLLKLLPWYSAGETIMAGNFYLETCPTYLAPRLQVFVFVFPNSSRADETAALAVEDTGTNV
jgi:hypothetical protein